MDGVFLIIVALICFPLCIYDLNRESMVPDISLSKGKIPVTNVAYFTICAIILFISLFRNPFVATDSANNYASFKYAMAGGASSLEYEIGYIWLLKVFSFFSENYVVYIRCCSLIVLLSLFSVIRRFPARSLILMLFIMGVLSATFDVLRGGISFSFVLLFYYFYFMKKKKGGFLFFLLALLFHTSALIYLILFFIARYLGKGGLKKWIILIGISFASFTPLLSYIVNFVIQYGSIIFSRMSKYYGVVGEDTDFSPTYVMMYAIPLILCYVYKNQITEDGFLRDWWGMPIDADLYNFLCNISYMMFLATLLSTSIPVMHRILKFGLVLIYINEGVVVASMRDSRDKLILIILLFCVNAFFAIVNNTGLNYTFYFGS